MEHRLIALLILCAAFMLIGIYIGWAAWCPPAAHVKHQLLAILAIETLDLIDEIVQGREGWCVELLDSNPDFGGPEWIIRVFGEWLYTDPGFEPDSCQPSSPGGLVWGYRRFEGRTRLHCLEQAVAAIKAKGV